jgi:hypothetical protein
MGALQAPALPLGYATKIIFKNFLLWEKLYMKSMDFVFN